MTMAWPCANANTGMRKIVTEKTARDSHRQL